MTTLITGATGFIGRRLVRPGDRALVRRPAGFQNEVVGDVLDPVSLARACERVETIFHCAGLADALVEAEAQWRVNVEGTRNLLAAAGQAGVKRFVFFSSVKAMAEPGDQCVDEDWLGEPATAYGRAKRAAEEAVLEAGAKFGMHVVNLRLAMVYGRGSRGNLWQMARAIRRGWFPALPEAGNRRSLVHVEDVIAAARLVAERPRANGRTYIIADPKPYSTHEIESAIRMVLGVRARWRLPVWALRGAARLGPRFAQITERLMASACYQPSRIARELGWCARTDLAAGLQEMLGEDNVPHS